MLADFRETGSETAFRELAGRYIDLVYSVARRLVDGDAHRAEDVAQTVFADLARKASKLPPDVLLGGWLHRHTCFVASNIMRTERRRQIRERHAVEMNALHSDPGGPEFSAMAPMIDEAINELSEADRTAIVLRFFEHRDFRAVGEAIGANEDAARMRVNRALERLEGALRRRGVTSTAAALGIILGVHAVHAAPAGLALAVSGAAALGGTAASAATTTQIIAMTTVQKTIITTALAVAIGAGLYQAKQASALRKEVAALEQKQAPLQAQIAQLEQQQAEAKQVLASLSEENDTLKKKPSEVLKLRGEVGRLQEEKSTLGRTAALSKATETPEARKFMREQQKAGMSMLYKELGRRVKLPEEKADQLNDLLADNIMENVDLITTVLRDGGTPAEVEQKFAALEAGLKDKVKSMLEPEAYAEYEEYTRNLVGLLSSEQFKGKLTGENEDKDAKKQQLYNLLLEETRAALTQAGLPQDYQLLPILNFRNIAFENEADRSLQLLSGVYEKVAARSTSFLSAEELKSFEEFRKQAIENSRMGLVMNRSLMMPIGK